MPSMNSSSAAEHSLDIAVVGMAGRFPGANNIEEFWGNLVNGVESVSWCSEQEIIDSGFPPEIARDPDFVPAAGKLDGEYMFDAEFFGFAPREAEIMDPQHRLFLECAWEAFESAGYNPETYSGRIGVYAGASTNTYFPFHIASNSRLISSVGLLQAIVANDKDFLASRVAYKLNLRGPAISVQTACSTSLVAVNLACMSLLNYQCDMILAGGVSVTPKGRLFKDGFIFSRDGHCRPFDEAAQGAVFGNGVGCVVLKRLEDALADGDHIYAVIKGSAVNNDGSLKAGYTAPSVSGQSAAIVEAQMLGGIDPQTIGYVEAHGTGTALGDPIEIAALTQAFQQRTNKPSRCAVGSVKGNIGHLDAAAGIGGLIKTALVLDRKLIPPTIHFQKASPHLDLENSPFFINAELRDWPADEFPRRAAVSSFGFGGTNAHAVLEEAPERHQSSVEDDWHIIPVSARTDAALQAASVRVGAFFQSHPTANLGDAAFTLQLGRKHFKKRGFAVVRKCTDAASIFTSENPKHLLTGENPEDVPSVIFMFPGQGMQSVNMAREIYQAEPLFRELVDQCAALASHYLNRNLIDLIYPADRHIAASETLLSQTEYAQPALFIIEYALAKLWQSWGIQPTAMIGHSVGEYVAACLAGVFSLEDAIKLICSRSVAMQEEPAGAMLSVPMSEKEVKALLPPNLSLAAVNAPSRCVVAGPLSSISDFQRLLEARGIWGRLLPVHRAFHSSMMEMAALRFVSAFDGVQMLAPQIPFISNLTGEWATAREVTCPGYWVRHMLSTVRFSDGWLHLARSRRAVFLEVGPGQILTILAGQCRKELNLVAETAVLASCGGGPRSDRMQILTSIGSLWIHGVTPDWSALHQGKTRYRVPLPTYPFQRKLYWLPPVHTVSAAIPACALSDAADVEDPVNGRHTEVESIPAKNGELEHVLAGIWKELLGIDEIGSKEDFFVLGGHSLMAIQLIAEVRRRTGAEISVKTLFQNPTVAALTKTIRASLASREPEAADQTIRAVPRIGDLPLTFHQEDVWEFETTMPGTARYTGIINMSLEGRLAPGGVEFAINRILARHEVLRTTYSANADGRPLAVVHPPQSLGNQVRDLSHLDAKSQRRELLRSANKLVATPFDLSQDVFIRPLLFKTSETQHVLMISSHYIAVDGWTVGLILREFGEHYAAYVEGRAANVPEVSLQCIDYAYWQRSQSPHRSLEIDQAYWYEQLRDLAPQELIPLDHPRPRSNAMNGSTRHFSLTKELTDNLKHFSHRHGSTLFFTLLSTLNVLFHLWSGSEDIVIGTITGDREPGMETVFGSFVNCLPLRNYPQRQETFLEVMANVRRCTSDAYAHQIPFHHIARTVKPETNLINEPLFRVSLVLRNIPFTEVTTAGLDIQLLPLPVDRRVSEGDMSLYLQETGGRLSGYFEYNRQIFEPSTMAAVAADFVSLLEEVTTYPQSRLSDFTISRVSAEASFDDISEVIHAG